MVSGFPLEKMYCNLYVHPSIETSQQTAQMLYTDAGIERRSSWIGLITGSLAQKVLKLSLELPFLYSYTRSKF